LDLGANKHGWMDGYVMLYLSYAILAVEFPVTEIIK